MGKRNSIDTSLTRLGDQYQYLIAFERFLESQEGDLIYIEQFADVSTKDTATEIKHHIDKDHKISDNHKDIWKTFKNFSLNHKIHINHKYLILLTTSEISQSSKFYIWNTLDKYKKLNVLKSIASNNPPETIQKFIDKIFSFNTEYNEASLLNILDKLTISDKHPILEEKIQEVIKHDFFKVIPKNNKKPYLDLLLGHIILIQYCYVVFF